MMKNITFEKIPSVSKILHDMGPQKSIHSSYLKFIIGIEIEKIRIQIKKGLNSFYKKFNNKKAKTLPPKAPIINPPVNLLQPFLV